MVDDGCFTFALCCWACCGRTGSHPQRKRYQENGIDKHSDSNPNSVGGRGWLRNMLGSGKDFSLLTLLNDRREKWLCLCLHNCWWVCFLTVLRNETYFSPLVTLGPSKKDVLDRTLLDVWYHPCLGYIAVACMYCTGVTSGFWVGAKCRLNARIMRVQFDRLSQTWKPLQMM